MTSDDFLAEIYADAQADEPRLVYGEWLRERGDPRGEFILLQCQIAKGDCRAELLTRQNELLLEHGYVWIAEAGLPSERATIDRAPEQSPTSVGFSRGFVNAVAIPADQIRTLARTLPLLEELVVRTDLGGNDKELQSLAALLCSRFPSGLRRIHVDRRRHCEHGIGDDHLEIRKDSLSLTLGRQRTFLPLVEHLCSQHPIRVVEVSFDQRGESEADSLLASLRGTQLVELTIHGADADWASWIAVRNLDRFLGDHPALNRLSLPPTSLTLTRLVHQELRELRLHWSEYEPYYGFSSEHGRPERGSGLGFFANVELPKLATLVVDLHYNSYIAFTEEDVAMLMTAKLPALRKLVIRRYEAGDSLIDWLTNAPFAADLESLDLVDCDFSDTGCLALIRHRAVFPQLRSLRITDALTRFGALSQEQLEKLQAVYPIDLVDMDSEDLDRI